MRRPIAQARHLRKCRTPAEGLLWSHLRNRKLCGFKFRRQHSIGTRVVDFFCLEALAIELDGSGHGFAGRQNAGAKRTLELEDGGLRIMRFWNSEVLEDVGWVLDAILLELDVEKSRWATTRGPSPQSSP